MTKYITGGKISSQKLKKFMAGKAITLNKSGDHDIGLHFKKLKDYNRYVRNLSANKGYVLKHDHLEDLTDHEGGSLFGNIKHAFHKIEHGAKRAFGKVAPIAKEVGKVALPIAKQAAKVALPIAKQVVQDSVTNAVGAYTRNPLMGQMAGQMAGNANLQIGNKTVGTGFFDVVKMLQKMREKSLQRKH